MEIEINRAPNPGFIELSTTEANWNDAVTAKVQVKRVVASPLDKQCLLLYFSLQLAFDDIDDSPFQFWFKIREYPCDSDCMEISLGDISVQPAISFNAAPGTYKVVCYVYDRHGAFAETVSVWLLADILVI